MAWPDKIHKKVRMQQQESGVRSLVAAPLSSHRVCSLSLSLTLVRIVGSNNNKTRENVQRKPV